MKISSKFTDGSTLVFEDVDQFLKTEKYENITFLKFEEYMVQSLPPLPPKLQILICQPSKLTTFPELPSSITNVHMGTGRIKELPDMSALSHLEFLDIHDHHIEHIHNPLPPNIRTLNLSFNKLRVITAPFPPTLVHLSLEFNFMLHAPLVHRDCIIINDHMYDDSVERAARFATTTTTTTTATAVAARPAFFHQQANQFFPTVRPETTTVYSNTQNVHSHSVQNGVSSSVARILDETKSMIDNPHLVKKVLAIFEQKRPNNTLLNKIRNFFSLKFLVAVPPIQEWCDQTDIHSIHGITFRELLLRVWYIIEKHEHRETLHAILRDELKASWGVCFTGRFSRIVNVLNGFMEGVEVGISPSEQMQGRISQIVRNGRKQNKLADDIKAEIRAVLDEFKVECEHVRQSWLDAVD